MCIWPPRTHPMSAARYCTSTGEPWSMAERASVEQALASPRIAIEAVTPAVEEGRFAAKALIGRPVALSAVLICDGHRKLGAEVLWRMTADEEWQALPMVHLGNDHWQVELRSEEHTSERQSCAHLGWRRL